MPFARILLAAVTAAIVTAVACGSDSPSTPYSPTDGLPQGNVFGGISVNHGHEAITTLSDIRAGFPISMDMRGGADHSHAVDLSAADIEQLKANETVTVESTMSNGHFHEVSFSPPAGL